MCCGWGHLILAAKAERMKRLSGASAGISSKQAKRQVKNENFQKWQHAYEKNTNQRPGSVLTRTPKTNHWSLLSGVQSATYESQVSGQKKLI